MPSPTFVYAGSTTDSKSKGIYAFRVQTENLEVSQNITLVPQGLAAETPNPTYLEVDTKRRLIFAVNSVKEGRVSVFAADAAGKLSLIGKSECASPSHCALHKDGAHLLVAGVGGVKVVPIAADGKPGAPTAATQFTQPVGVAFDVPGRFAFACSPSQDKVFIYRFDQGKLTESGSIAVKRGAYPRRIAFRPDGKFAYLINQNDSTIT